MKKFFNAILPAVAMLAIVSCSDNDPDPKVTIDFAQTQIEYDESGVWKENLNTEYNYIDFQGVRFSHKAEVSEWGTFWSGFCPSRSNDTNEYSGADWMQHQWDSMSGGGIGKGTPCLIAYWNSMEEASPAEPTLKMEMADGTPIIPQSLYINNTTYGYYTMLNGSAYSKKFAEGDWTKVSVYAVYTDNSESEPLDIYLVDYRDADKAKWVAVKDWTLVDLSKLNNAGAIKYIYFQISSSDSGQWGMNIPAYFAIDRPTVLIK